jgi:hypothetical protein
MAGHFAPYCPVQFLGSISKLSNHFKMIMATLPKVAQVEFILLMFSRIQFLFSTPELALKFIFVFHSLFTGCNS